MPRKSTRSLNLFSLTPPLPSIVLLSLMTILVIVLLHHFSSHISSLCRDSTKPWHSSRSPKPLLFYALGCLTPSFLIPTMRHIAAQICSGRAQLVRKKMTAVENSRCGSDQKREAETGESGKRSLLYGLDHSVLNAQITLPETMWMNMGYWKVSGLNPFLFIFTCIIG